MNSRRCSPALLVTYDVARRVVDRHVVEGVQVVREGRVHRQVRHRQDPQVGPPEDLDLHREGSRRSPGLPDLVEFLAEVVVACILKDVPLYLVIP